MGAERYNLFTGCPLAKTATIVLRGGSDQFIDEADRSLHDAIMIVRRALKHAEVVPRGGAIKMEVGHLVATACIGGGAGKVGGWAWRGRGGGGARAGGHRHSASIQQWQQQQQCVRLCLSAPPLKSGVWLDKCANAKECSVGSEVYGGG